jgi:hypothetical protein
VPLSSAQRAQIKAAIGVAFNERDFGADSKSAERAMDAIAGYPKEEAEVVASLVRLTAIDGKLDAIYSRLKAQQVGSIVLRGRQEIDDLHRLGREQVRRIAAKLGVRIHRRAAYRAPADCDCYEC